MIKKFFFILLLPLSLYTSEVCFFIPTQGWKIAHPDMLSPRVRICFLGASSKGFAPSINLATEPVKISLEAYVNIVRKSYLENPNNRWRDLGKFKTPLGEGRLTELESPTKVGISRIVQLIIIKDNTAYILTAGALKEEFSKYYQTFDQVFHSLQMTSNLVESYTSKAQQEVLKGLFNQLEKELSNQCLMIKDMTAYILTAHEEFDQIVYFSPLEFYSSQVKQELLKRLVNERQKEFSDASQESVLTKTIFNSETFQNKGWKPFEKKIINDFTEMGPYWQILLLQQIYDRLLTPRST